MFEKVEANSERWFSLENLKNEEWKDVEGYEGLYQVSNYGRVKSLEKNAGRSFRKSKILNLNLDTSKYGFYVLSCNSKIKHFTAHRLVAKTYILNKEDKPQINHIDGNKLNNNIYNLEWCTDKENKEHGWKNKIYKYCEKRYKKIYQYDLNKNLLKEWNSVKEICEKTNYNKVVIYKCIKRVQKTAYGYIWKAEI